MLSRRHPAPPPLRCHAEGQRTRVGFGVGAPLRRCQGPGWPGLDALMAHRHATDRNVADKMHGYPHDDWGSRATCRRGGAAMRCRSGASAPRGSPPGGMLGSAHVIVRDSRRPLVEGYAGQQVVGIDLHRRRSVIVWLGLASPAATLRAGIGRCTARGRIRGVWRRRPNRCGWSTG